MKIPVPCAICFIEGRKKEEQTGMPQSITLWPGRLADAGYVEVVCKNGHNSVVILDERKHDLLLQSATLAFLDGYAREAVASYCSAHERLFEFFIRVVSRKENTNPEAFETTWKMVCKQSERQLGAFLLLYAMQTSEAFWIDTKLVEFRNKVIHQGYIPSDSEVLAYGEHVFNAIRTVTKLLKSKYMEFYEAEVKQELTIRTNACPKRQHPPFGMGRTSANLVPGTNQAVEIETFQSHVHAMKSFWRS